MGTDIISVLIFILVIILFIIDKLPMATVAIGGCVAMVLLGVCDFKEVFSPFASSTVILLIAVMMIGATIAESGLANIVGNWVVKISKNSERILIIGAYIVAAIMSAFLANAAVLAIFIPIIMGLSKTNRTIKEKNVIMPIAIACVLGGASTLVGSTQQMTAQGLLEESGVRVFKTFDFLLVGAVITVIGLIYCVFVGQRRGEKIWGECEKNYEVSIEKKEFKAIKKSKAIIMLVIFIATVILYITEIIPIALTACLSAIICIVTGCISQEKAIISVNWNIVGRLAGCLGIAKAMEISGGTELLRMGFERIISDKINPYFLFCIFVILTHIISLFISNSTAILIVLPIILAIAPGKGLNIYSFALGITLASGTSLMCPLASSTLGMSMGVGYRFNDYFRYSFFLDLIIVTIILVMVPMIYGLMV